MVFWSMHSEYENSEGYRGLGSDTVELYREFTDVNDLTWVTTDILLN